MNKTTGITPTKHFQFQMSAFDFFVTFFNPDLAPYDVSSTTPGLLLPHMYCFHSKKLGFCFSGICQTILCRGTF